MGLGFGLYPSPESSKLMNPTPPPKKNKKNIINPKKPVRSLCFTTSGIRLRASQSSGEGGSGWFSGLKTNSCLYVSTTGVSFPMCAADRA